MHNYINNTEKGRGFEIKQNKNQFSVVNKSKKHLKNLIKNNLIFVTNG